MAMRTRSELTVQHPDAAGIDIGGKSHFVAVPPGRSDTPVREFGCFTEDLPAMASWLLTCGVTIVALESTGVYWVPVFEVLESHGLAVVLVNAQRQNVSGRKSDVLDCQWLQQLMSYGLLPPPSAAGGVCALRAVSRQRDTLLQEQARCVQRMRKALTLMNVQLANTLTDIVGQTGLAILRAIVAGERDPQVLAKLRNYRVKASAADLAKSLEGTWQDEHLFCLGQALSLYDTYRALIAEADAKLAALIAPLRAARTPRRRPVQQARRKARAGLRRARGVAGMGRGGPDADRRHRRQHRAEGAGGTRAGPREVQERQALLLLAGAVPRHADFRRPTRLSGASKRIPNRVARALKLAAQGLHHSQCGLGAYYRRMAARLGKGKRHHRPISWPDGCTRC
jgi:transposase